MTYNGWKNYETWNVALWIGNEQYSDAMARSMAEDAYAAAVASEHNTRKENAAIGLAESLKSWVEEQNPLANQASTFVDLLGAALGEVDWREIAENFLEDVGEAEGGN